VQTIILLQVPLYVVGMLFVRLISALKANQFDDVGQTSSISSYALFLNYVLMQRFGVVGIALATSLMYLISCCFLMVSRCD